VQSRWKKQAFRIIVIILPPLPRVTRASKLVCQMPTAVYPGESSSTRRQLLRDKAGVWDMEGRKDCDVLDAGHLTLAIKMFLRYCVHDDNGSN
jgi:hypothetical protein